MGHFEIIKSNWGLVESDKKIKNTLYNLGLSLQNKNEHKIGVIVEKPINADSPELFNNYFESTGYKVCEPLPLVNDKIKTLFTVAGVQMLDPMIHDGAEIKEGKFFVAQPVLRTQYLPSVGEGSLTSFVNLSTEIVNGNYQDHVEAVSNWLKLIEKIGFKKDGLSAYVSHNKNQWGKRLFENEVIGIIYNNIEIGEAGFIEEMPQDNRPPISISDIGFGFERMNYALSGSTLDDCYAHKDSIKLIDSARTQVLLVGSGVEPTNTAQGYRVRLFSKNFVRESLPIIINPINIFNQAYERWSKWVKFSINKDLTRDILLREFDRNFNREILNYLQKNNCNIEININQPTADFVQQIVRSGFKNLSLVDDIYKLYAKK